MKLIPQVVCMNIKKSVLLAVFVCLALPWLALAQVTYEVTPQTGIEFSNNYVVVLEDSSNRLTAEQAMQQLDRFVPASEIADFKPSVTY